MEQNAAACLPDWLGEKTGKGQRASGYVAIAFAPLVAPKGHLSNPQLTDVPF
jgi:hypothetical protein